MQHISNDVIERVSTYLLANELGRLGLTCIHLHTLIYDSGPFSALLWRQLLARASTSENKLHYLHVNSILAHARRDLLKSQEGGDHDRNKVDEVKCLSETSRRLQAIASLDTFCWRIPMGVSRLPKMEGHAATLIAGGSVWAIVSGWDMAADNSLILLEVSQVPELKRISCTTRNNPVFRYGFSAVTLTEDSRRQLNASTAWCTGSGDCKPQKERFSANDRGNIKGDSIIVYGGCRGGGYTGDCSNLYEIIVQMPEDNPDGDEAIATYRQLHTVGTHLTRGYHSANLVVVDGDPCLMVFGGFHHSSATDSLELLHLPSLSWIPIGDRISGTPPCERFGHSMTPLKEFSGLLATLHADLNSKLERVRSDGTDDSLRRQSSPALCRTSSACSQSSSSSVLSSSSTENKRYILIGGSDGSDLIRDGRELLHVYVLDLIRASSGDTFQWSCPSIYFPEGTSHKEIVGRCHSAAVVGSKIVLYGGSARCQNTQIYVLDTEPTVLPTFPPPVNGDNEMRQEDDNKSSTPYNSFVQENEEGTVSSDAFVYYRGTVNKVGTASPVPRISAVTVVAGGYLLVFGGFSRGSLGNTFYFHRHYICLTLQ